MSRHRDHNTVTEPSYATTYIYVSPWIIILDAVVLECDASAEVLLVGAALLELSQRLVANSLLHLHHLLQTLLQDLNQIKSEW